MLVIVYRYHHTSPPVRLLSSHNYTVESILHSEDQIFQLPTVMITNDQYAIKSVSTVFTIKFVNFCRHLTPISLHECFLLTFTIFLSLSCLSAVAFCQPINEYDYEFD